MNCLYQTKRISDLKEKMLSSKRYASIEQARIVTRVYQENENLKDAVEKLNKISEDEKMQRIIELREKAIRDEHAIYEKGVNDGVEKGSKEKELQIAKNMLKKGIKESDIKEITGLTKEEIEELKRK